MALMQSAAKWALHWLETGIEGDTRHDLHCKVLWDLLGMSCYGSWHTELPLLSPQYFIQQLIDGDKSSTNNWQKSMNNQVMATKIAIIIMAQWLLQHHQNYLKPTIKWWQQPSQTIHAATATDGRKCSNNQLAVATEATINWQQQLAITEWQQPKHSKTATA